MESTPGKTQHLPLRKRLRMWVLRGALMGFSTLFALLVCEFGLRLVQPQQLINLRPDIWEPVEGLGWQYAANLDTVINTGEGEVRLVTDARRNRTYPGSPDSPASAGKRILLLGDSFATALQVDYEQTFAALLEQRLSEQIEGGVAIANTGVGGWGPNHYHIKLKQELAAPKHDWDMAAVFLFLGNDVEDKRVESFAPRPSSVKKFGWPRRLSMKELKAKILYPINNALETRSHLFSLVKDKGKFLLMRLGLSAHYFPKVLLLEQKEGEAWELTAELCSEMQATASAHGVPITFFLIPGVYMVDPAIATAYAEALDIPSDAYNIEQPSAIMTRLLNERGLPVVDLTPQFIAAKEKALFGTVDTHLSPDGHEVVAEGAEQVVRAALGF